MRSSVRRLAVDEIVLFEAPPDLCELSRQRGSVGVGWDHTELLH